MKWICISKPELPDSEESILMVKKRQSWIKDFASEIHKMKSPYEGN